MPDPADLDFLGLTVHGDGRSSFELTRPLSRLDGMLYGGTGLAASIAAMEAASGRDIVWATSQFVATVGVGTRIDCHAEVLAAGRRASQVRVTATAGDDVLFVALGSTAVTRPDAFAAQFGSMPDVAAPGDSPPLEWRLPIAVPAKPTGFLLAAEFRSVPGAPPGRVMSWARLRDGRPMTRAAMAFVADMVPMGVARGAGRAGGGRSLDNSMRFGPPPDTDWVLVDVEPHLAHGGIGHGLARVWAEDGTLLGVATQSASMLLFD